MTEKSRAARERGPLTPKSSAAIRSGRDGARLPSVQPSVHHDARAGLAAHLIKALLHRVCLELATMPFRVRYWDGTSETFGDGPPAFQVTFRSPAAAWKVVRAPDPAFGDAYMAGEVDVDALEPLLELVLRARLPRLARLRWPLRHARGTSVSRQYRDIQSHYDRGNAFFSLWLDSSRTYSCAYFGSETDDLDRAQARKVDHVLRKAQLRPGDTLLDIGSGWGALILRAGQQYGVRAHGITLSRQQYDYTLAAIDAAKLTGQVSVDLLDYRELGARGVEYDRIVSVGMLEHVGRRNLPVFLQTVRSVLKPGGIGVLHFITRAREEPVGPWIRKHIFPGGYVPSWREVIALLPEFGFHLTDAESLRRHYVLTLSHWARRFEERLDEVRALGFDESFIRMWRLYLRSCATGFRIGSLDLHQLVFTHGINNALPLTRDYLYTIAPAGVTGPATEVVS